MTLYGIPVQNVPTLTARLAAANRRAERLGVTPITYAPTGAGWCTFLRNGAPTFKVHGKREVAEFSVEGGRITLSGWTFVARAAAQEEAVAK